jgi:hypothetical protein
MTALGVRRAKAAECNQQRFLTQMRSADRIKQRLSLEAKRKTSAQVSISFLTAGSTGQRNTLIF